MGSVWPTGPILNPPGDVQKRGTTDRAPSTNRQTQKNRAAREFLPERPVFPVWLRCLRVIPALARYVRWDLRTEWIGGDPVPY
jgi:hypothetical protein